MSKYKYLFSVEMNIVGAKKQETIDLVNDWNHTESELDNMTDSELNSMMDELYNEWVWENISGGVHKLEDQNE